MRRRLLTGAWSADRFWRHVQKGDGCWEWQGTRNWFNYGLFWDTAAGQLRAHRVSWELTNGPIPDRMNVCHQCDNPPCVRPDHLYLGDQKRNIGDAVARGRMPSGEDHHLAKIDQWGAKNKHAKLTEGDVIEIRRRYLAGESKHTIAPDFGIHPNHVNRVVSGLQWSHLPGGKPQPAHSGKRL
jgi:hypothetical protein